jgi:hypothetical protein|tara:strand:+ start:7 stop:408 length:402 start_codon:yes stop_codon:yes gene_type:complete
MLFHDFECKTCGKRQEDVGFSSHTKVQRRIPCKACDGEANMVFSKSNALHQNHSSMYGKYHAGFGCVVESYSHKQQLLREYNVVESSDAVGGSRCHITADVTSPNMERPEGPEWSFGATPDEAVAAAKSQMKE